MKKSKSEKIHALRAIRRRYKIDLTSEEYESLCNKIIKGESDCIEKISNTRTRHLVEYEGTLLECIYDKKRQRIVTFYES